MIIDTIVCNYVSRELTDLMRAYNIDILTVEAGDYARFVMSYRANRIFESTQFKELAKLLDEVVSPARMIWDEVAEEYRDLFTVGKEYDVVSFHGPADNMAKVYNDANGVMLVSINSSVYGENRVFLDA